MTNNVNASRTYENARNDALVAGLASWMLDSQRNPAFWSKRYVATTTAK